MKKQPTIKILVGYHKPAALLKSDILVPIHLGRAVARDVSKDGIMDEKDYRWMVNNMIGDDTGKNISHLNREFCELTALYWAWKNYNLLGNPDYVGFMHYRRQFVFNSLLINTIKPDAFNLIKIRNIGKNDLSELGLNKNVITEILRDVDCIYSYNQRKETPQEYRKNHWASPFKDYLLCLKLLEEQYPSFCEISREYNSGKRHFWSQMFILSREDFFGYCEWLFNILFELHHKINYTGYNVDQRRSVAYCAESLNGIYALYLEKEKHKFLKSSPIAFIQNTNLPIKIDKLENGSIPIVFSADKNYYLYLGVAIQSIIENKKAGTKYDIIILETDLNNFQKEKLEKLSQNDVSVRVVDITDVVEKYKIHRFMTINHIKEAAYSRLLVGEILENYHKAIYLDCDLVVLTDLSEIYNIDLSNKCAAVVKDYLVADIFTRGREFVKYMKDVLKVDDASMYFNSGVLVFNLDLMRERKMQNKLLSVAEINNKWFHDQNVLNSVFYNDVVYMDGSYNVNYHLIFDAVKHLPVFPRSDWEKYLLELKNPKILHFTSGYKPWKQPDLPNADYFWYYARRCPFYEEILYKNIIEQKKETGKEITKGDAVPVAIVKDALQYSSIRMKYYRYLFLSKITLGKMRKHYQDKKREYRNRLQTVHRFMN